MRQSLLRRCLSWVSDSLLPATRLWTPPAPDLPRATLRWPVDNATPVASTRCATRHWHAKGAAACTQQQARAGCSDFTGGSCSPLLHQEDGVAAPGIARCLPLRPRTQWPGSSVLAPCCGGSNFRFVVEKNGRRLAFRCARRGRRRDAHCAFRCTRP